MIQREIVYFGQRRVAACDGKCSKAWGISDRPRVQLDPEDEDDYAFLADGELGKAPGDPGTYEGGDAKPRGSRHGLNKWCVRACERSELYRPGESVVLRDFSRRRYNDPTKDPDYAPAAH